MENKDNNDRPHSEGNCIAGLRQQERWEKRRESNCCFILSFLAKLIYRNQSAIVRGDHVVTRRSLRTKGIIEVKAKTNMEMLGAI